MNNEVTPEKRSKFLAALREIPNVSRAAREAEISRMHVYRLRDADAEFAKEWDDALDEGVEMLEAEAHRRAFQGTDRPVTHQGEITATYKEYSDTLAIFLLKAHRPERFRERSEVKHEGLQDLAEALRAGRDRTLPLV